MSINKRNSAITVISKPVGFVLILLIKFYRTFISPMLGQNCRFQPTCSGYALQAIEIHGPIKGVYLAIKRISKCHPLNDGGHDPVPEPVSKRNK